MRKIYVASWNFTLTAEADRVFVSTCDVFHGLFPLNVLNEIQLLRRVFCYSWLLCFFGFWLRNTSLVNIEWVQIVLQNCEILHSVRGLGDKNSASWYYFNSDVMYKKYNRLVYTSPDLLARFCKVNLSNAKHSAWFVFQA